MHINMQKCSRPSHWVGGAGCLPAGLAGAVAVLHNQRPMGNACGHTAICGTIYEHTCITVYLKKNYIFSLLQN